MFDGRFRFVAFVLVPRLHFITGNYINVVAPRLNYYYWIGYNWFRFRKLLIEVVSSLRRRIVPTRRFWT